MKLMKLMKKGVAIALATIMTLSLPNGSIFATEVEVGNSLEEDGINQVYPEVEGEETSLQINMNTGNIKEINGPISNDTNFVPNGAISDNYVLIAITPQATNYKLSIINIGIDSIQSVSLNTKVYADSGSLLKTGAKVFKNVKPGITTWTWNCPKGKTAQEKIKVNGTAKDGTQVINFSGSTTRYNFEGGQYSKIAAYDGHRHHMPSKSVSPLSKNKGPAIRMTKLDHMKTASYGKSASATQFRNNEKKLINAGRFLAAQQLGISDIRNEFGSKYNAAINQMVIYTKSLGYKK